MTSPQSAGGTFAQGGGPKKCANNGPLKENDICQRGLRKRQPDPGLEN